MRGSLGKVASSVAALLLLATMSLVPTSLAQAPGPSYQQPTLNPPLNTAILKNPSGTYIFYNITSTSYSMNLTSYEKLLNDPYSTPPRGEARVVGNMVVFSTTSTASESVTSEVNPGGLPSYYPAAYSSNWSGAGGGDCSSMSVNSAGDGFVCNGSEGTLGTAGVYSASLTWDPKCYSGSTCMTAFWAGLSPSNSANSPLVQNGIAVCVNDAAACPNGGADGKMTWFTWYEIYPAAPQPTESAPTAINGTVNEFVFAFGGLNSVGFQWQVGSWYYAEGVSSNYPQTDFYQAEGIMESPLAPAEMVEWSPSPNTMTGWWETGQWCGCTYQGGNLGSSYTVALYHLTTTGTSSGTEVAYGSIVSYYQFSDTFA